MEIIILGVVVVEVDFKRPRVGTQQVDMEEGVEVMTAMERRYPMSV